MIKLLQKQNGAVFYASQCIFCSLSLARMYFVRHRIDNDKNDVQTREALLDEPP